MWPLQTQPPGTGAKVTLADPPREHTPITESLPILIRTANLTISEYMKCSGMGTRGVEMTGNGMDNQLIGTTLELTYPTDIK